MQFILLFTWKPVKMVILHLKSVLNKQTFKVHRKSFGFRMLQAGFDFWYLKERVFTSISSVLYGFK